MKVAIIYNKDLTGVINSFGAQNKELYKSEVVKTVKHALEKAGHNVEIIDGNMHVIEALQDFMPKVMEGERMGMVFNMAYGIQGESRYTHIPSLLEMLGLPYVGSTPSGHALALDKVITKIILQKNNIPTPDFRVFSSPDDPMDDVLFPAIVKPKMEAVSFGLKVVHNKESLREAVDFIITEFKQQALVEKFIRGREFAIGLLGNNPPEVFPIVEIDLGNEPFAIQTNDHKVRNPRRKICPANLPPGISQKMKELSIAAFYALQLRDFSRVDIRMDENDNIYLLEINSMASLGATGSYVLGAKTKKYDFDSLVNKMLDIAVYRYFSYNPEYTLNINSKIPLHSRIKKILAGKETESLEMLKKMVNTNTYIRNIDGVNELGSYLKKQFIALGFEHETIEQLEVGNMYFFTNSPAKDVDILFTGNLDNTTKLSEQTYFYYDKQKICGSGVWEHKGGLAVLLVTLKILRTIKMLKKMHLGVLLTTDESLNGKYSGKILKRLSSSAKYVIGLRGGGQNGHVVSSRSGAAVYSYNMNLLNGMDATHVIEAVKLFNNTINSWVNLSNEEDALLISPSTIQLSSNITEPYASGECTLSIRFNKLLQFESLDAKIRKSIKKKYNRFIYSQIEGGIRRPPMHRTSTLDVMITSLQSVSKTLDLRIKEEHRWSSSNINLAEHCSNKIDGLGPAGYRAKDDVEYIYSKSLNERVSLLSLLMLELQHDMHMQQLTKTNNSPQGTTLPTM